MQNTGPHRNVSIETRAVGTSVAPKAQQTMTSSLERHGLLFRVLSPWNCSPLKSLFTAVALDPGSNIGFFSQEFVFFDCGGTPPTPPLFMTNNFMTIFQSFVTHSSYRTFKDKIIDSIFLVTLCTYRVFFVFPP